jgi:hypothetical protein
MQICKTASMMSALLQPLFPAKKEMFEKENGKTSSITQHRQAELLEAEKKLASSSSAIMEDDSLVMSEHREDDGDKGVGGDANSDDIKDSLKLLEAEMAAYCAAAEKELVLLVSDFDTAHGQHDSSDDDDDDDNDGLDMLQAVLKTVALPEEEDERWFLWDEQDETAMQFK